MIYISDSFCIKISNEIWYPSNYIMYMEIYTEHYKDTFWFRYYNKYSNVLGLFYGIVHYPPHYIMYMEFYSDYYKDNLWFRHYNKYSNVLGLFYGIVHYPPPHYIMYMEIYTEHYKDNLWFRHSNKYSFFLGLFYVIVHYPLAITLCTWKFIQNIIRILSDSDILINILYF